MMTKIKTTQNSNSITEFLNSVEDEKKRDDAIKLIGIIKKETELEPKMWGSSIIGFGSYHYKYESGHEGDAPLVGLSPRKAAISIYLSPSFENKEKRLEQLGKYKVGKGCIYIKKLEDIDIEILKIMILESIQFLKDKYPLK